MLIYTQDDEEVKEALDSADAKFKDLSKLKGGSEVIIAKDTRKEVYFVSNKLMKLFKIIQPKKHPYTIGFYFGELQKEFKPSFEALYKYAKVSDHHKVVISRKEEMRFLYGRDIRASQIRKYDKSLGIGDEMIICNKSNEALGTGVLVSDIKTAKRSDRIIKNTMDRGWYLRHKE